MKNYSALFVASLFLLGCKGNTGNDNPVPPQPPVSKTYGFFRQLQPKATLAKQVAQAAFNPSITMATPRAAHKALDIGGGKFMLIGGEQGVNHNTSFTGTSIIDIFDSNTEQFTQSSVITNVARRWYPVNGLSFCLVRLPNGNVLMFGGDADITCSNTEIYNPVSNTINKVFPRCGINNADNGFYMGSNKILLTGTRNYPSANWDTTYQNSVMNLTDSTITTYPAPASNQSAVQLADGSVIVAGGYTIDSTNSQVSQTGIYKLTVDSEGTLVSELKGQLQIPRHHFSMCLLSDGNIGIYGGIKKSAGQNTEEALKSVEVLNTTTWTSTLNVDLLAARYFTHAVQLQSGYVLNAGGESQNDSIVSDEFVHNHLLRLSGTTGTLNTARKFYSVIPLNNGRLLISGGETGTSNLNTAEIYDPAVKVLISYDTASTIPVSLPDVPSTIHFTSNDPTVTWSVSPVIANKDAGSITASGIYTAPTTPVSVVVTATAGTNTASVIITVIGE